MLRITLTIGIVLLHYQQYLVQGGMHFGHLWVDATSEDFQFRLLVEVFFALSGYLQFIYIKRIREGLSFRKYYVAKLIRLLPVLAVCVIAYEVFLAILLSNGTHSWLHPIVPNLWGIVTAMSGVAFQWCFSSGGVLMESWYIGGLLLCYAIFYFIIYYSKRKKISENYLFFLMVLLGCSLLSVNPQIPFIMSSGGRAYSSFFIGLLLASYKNSKGFRVWHYVTATLLIICVIFSCIFTPSFTRYGQPFIMSLIIAPSCITLMESTFMRRLFSHKGIGTVGAWTYSVYLWQMPLMLIFLDILDWSGRQMDFSQPKVFLFFLIAVFITGAISFYGIERPALKFLRKKADRLNENGTNQ